jgi:hypothetical protein
MKKQKEFCRSIKRGLEDIVLGVMQLTWDVF